MSVRIIRSTDLAACLAIRYKVFCDEQGVDEAVERDEFDDTAWHFLALADGTPVGTARIAWTDNRAKIGRVAVYKDWRGSGVGKALMQHMLEIIDARPEISETILSAQIAAQGLYSQFGFVPGREEVLENIPHIWMVRPRPG